ncbi:rhomboid family intramembrane serine protease [Sphingobacterium griseoflavum]|uniref:Peptidase S54 rhomboid domain-containing protein n=1 Tax=Sphingobacterium griseoflavum TaxID=1474952 RepID=A0ABQ3HVH9_9SPHI|nr:rhomboid family intramembrane serine protease [Sphingobacterium griseoflavum]GHE23398.1 hypothetical protein GCM10017764_03660 [Sphingobacterium griseoflavum]
MSLFDVLPTFYESPYSYTLVPIVLISSIIGFYRKTYFHALLLHPYEVARGKRIHTLLTSAFIHRSWLHLLFNSLIIYALAYDMFGCIKQENGLLTAALLTPCLFIILIVVPNLFQVWIKRNNFFFTSVGISGLTLGLYGFGLFFFPEQKADNIFIAWVSNSLEYWIVATVFLFLLSFIPKIGINRQLHIIAFHTGSFLALLVRPESLAEMWPLILNLTHENT